MTPSPSPAPVQSWQATFKRLGAAGPVALVLSFLPLIGGLVLLSQLTTLGPWLRSHGEQGLVVYFAVTALLMGLSIVPTFSCAILAGWAFGFARGTPLAIGSIVVAGFIAYAIGRWIARDRVIEIVRERPEWDAIHRALLSPAGGQALFVVTLVRLPPNSPFAFVNFILAAGKVRLLDYAIGTLLGIAPRTALGVFVGAGLEQLDLKAKAQTWLWAAGFIVLLAVVAIIGRMAQRALAQLSQSGAAAQ